METVGFVQGSGGSVEAGESDVCGLLQIRGWVLGDEFPRVRALRNVTVASLTMLRTLTSSRVWIFWVLWDLLGPWAG